MSTITIEVEDDLARRMEEAARRAHQSVSEWVKERIKPAAETITSEDEPLADQTHLGLDDFPSFAEVRQQRDRVSRDVIYDERGR